MRNVLGGVGFAILAVLICAFIYRAEVLQLYRLIHLYDEDSIVYNFQHMNQLFPTTPIEGGGRVIPFERGDYVLPETFEHEGQTFETKRFLADANTTGLLVYHDGRVIYEEYFGDHSAEGTHIAWSVSKSFVSAMFGIAVSEGLIPDIMQPVTDYLPELEGSGYDGVPIKHVLQMSSGVAFNEDYGDPDSDINRMAETLALGGSLLDFAATLESERPSGTVQHYVSVDTQVLGTILVRVTGMSLSEYTSQKIWKPMGMESAAYWIVDGTGMEMALGGLNASLRDFARLGVLYLNRGNWQGNQIVPEAWYEASTTPDAPHLMPGIKPESDNRMGYGYQWWIPEEWDNDFMALGIYNQMIYVDPNSGMVVARHSANRDFQRDNFEPTRESLALWRTIAREVTQAD